MIDFGAAGNFIDQDNVDCLNLPVLHLIPCLQAKAIDSTIIGQGDVTLCTEPIQLQVRTLHHESLSLLVTMTTEQPIVSGLPWLKLHDPVISLQSQEIQQCSSYCLQHCLKEVQIQLVLTHVLITEDLTKSLSSTPILCL